MRPRKIRGKGRIAERRLSVQPLLGRFLVLDDVVEALERILPTYRGSDGTHEGIALLCGVELPRATLFTTALFPAADHQQGYVRASEEQFAAASATAREHGLGVLAQVHTHPGGQTVHSCGDDDMVRPRFEGMLSIVAPHHGRFGLRPLDSLGVHQLQSGVWVLAERRSVRENFVVIPSSVDLR